jgi:hypothetical protein
MLTRTIQIRSAVTTYLTFPVRPFWHQPLSGKQTHGLINSQRPELSGIVLSLVDELGRPQNGFLQLYDIYNLKLAADLVGAERLPDCAGQRRQR